MRLCSERGKLCNATTKDSYRCACDAAWLPMEVPRGVVPADTIGCLTRPTKRHLEQMLADPAEANAARTAAVPHCYMACLFMLRGCPVNLLPVDAVFRFTSPYNSCPQFAHIPSKTGLPPTLWPCKYDLTQLKTRCSETQAFLMAAHWWHCYCHNSCPRSRHNCRKQPL